MADKDPGKNDSTAGQFDRLRRQVRDLDAGAAMKSGDGLSDSPSVPSGDSPIEDWHQDRLNRAQLAEVLSQEIATVDAKQGSVIAITGGWGTGKTSLMNLCATNLREDPRIVAVVDFNPWLFSGAEEITSSLVDSIASEVSKQASGSSDRRGQAEAIVNKLHEYVSAAAFIRGVPIVGSTQAGLKESLEFAQKKFRGSSLIERRNAASEALASLEGRIVVLVDDIDRLTRPEIRDLFRAVRLSAAFPNTIYLLCLDRQVVEQALDEEGFSGRAYLEKILTITCRVPDASKKDLNEAFRSGLRQSAAVQKAGGVTSKNGPQIRILSSVVFPLLRTMRDVKRVLAVLPISLALSGKDLPVAEVIALETIRTVRPELHAKIAPCSDALTASQEVATPQLLDQLDDFLAAENQSEVAYAAEVVATLFPKALFRLRSSRKLPRELAIGAHVSSTRLMGSHPDLRVKSVSSAEGLASYLSLVGLTNQASVVRVRMVERLIKGGAESLLADIESLPDLSGEELAQGINAVVDTLSSEQAANVAHVVGKLIDSEPALWGASDAVPALLERIEDVPQFLITEGWTSTAPGSFQMTTAIAYADIESEDGGGPVGVEISSFLGTVDDDTLLGLQGPILKFLRPSTFDDRPRPNLADPGAVSTFLKSLMRPGEPDPRMEWDLLDGFYPPESLPDLYESADSELRRTHDPMLWNLVKALHDHMQGRGGA